MNLIVKSDCPEEYSANLLEYQKRNYIPENTVFGIYNGRLIHAVRMTKESKGLDWIKALALSLLGSVTIIPLAFEGVWDQWNIVKNRQRVVLIEIPLMDEPDFPSKTHLFPIEDTITMTTYNSASTPLCQFYRGEETDTEGRMIQDVWDYNLEQKENQHDYIQWLFPTKNLSDFNFNAPLLTSQDIQAFKNDPLLKKNLKRSFVEMMHFYGFEYQENTNKVIRASNFNERIKVWLNPNNHNYYRITRILDCLNTIGMENEKNAFYEALVKLNDDFGSRIVVNDIPSFPYWQNAADK